MVHSTKAHGKMINNTVEVRRLGLMEPCMRETMFLERNMEKEHLYGRMGLSILDSSITTILKEWENINGQMVVHIMVNGRIIKCMDEEFLIGLMVVNMRVNISKIRNRAWAPSIGLMVASTWANGPTESNMVEVLL
jgi:hypothetical protein